MTPARAAAAGNTSAAAAPDRNQQPASSTSSPLGRGRPEPSATSPALADRWPGPSRQHPARRSFSHRVSGRLPLRRHRAEAREHRDQQLLAAPIHPEHQTFSAPCELMHRLREQSRGGACRRRLVHSSKQHTGLRRMLVARCDALRGVFARSATGVGGHSCGVWEPVQLGCESRVAISRQGRGEPRHRAIRPDSADCSPHLLSSPAQAAHS